jgi:uncharacterized protein YndB with AHSA1/START domain
MNDTITLDPQDAHGEVLSADTVRLQRLLPGPIERVWRYLTEPQLRAQWMAGGPMELRPGGAIEFVFHNNSLTTPDDPPPPAYAPYAGEHRMRSRVLACEPPRLLAYTWDESQEHPSEVRMELTPQGSQVLLVVTHQRLRSRDGMLSVSAGWHTHLAVLRAALEGRRMEGFWRTFSRLHADYDARLG